MPKTTSQKEDEVNPLFAIGVIFIVLSVALPALFAAHFLIPLTSKVLLYLGIIVIIVGMIPFGTKTK